MKLKILLLVIFLLALIPTAGATNIWWDSTFTKRIDNHLNSGSVPYQLNITVHFGSGVNSATDVYITCTQNDCGDVRPLLNNVTQLKYWWESQPSGVGTSGKIWINMTSSAAGDVLNLYYGKAVSTTQNGWATFIFYDDFTVLSAANWTIGAGCTSSGTKLTCAPQAGQTEQVYSKQTYARPISIRTKITALNTNSWEGFVGYGSVYSGNFHTMWGNSAGSEFINYNQGVNTNIPGTTFPTGTYEYTILSTGAKAYKDATFSIEESATTTSPSSIFLGSGATTGTSNDYDWVFVRHFQAAPLTWGTWGSEITYTIPTTTIISPTNNSYWNASIFPNFTWNNVTCNYCDPLNFYAQYSYSATFATIYNETNYTNNINTTLFNTSGGDGTIYLRVAVNDTHNQGAWSPTITTHLNNSGISLLYPANGSIQSANSVVLQWSDTTFGNDPYTYQLATDYQFINIVSSGTGTNNTMLYSSGTLLLNYGTTYYWRAKNVTTSTYSNWFNFTISPFSPPATTLNITARDEITFAQISNFTVMLYSFSGTTPVYNSTRTTTTGWVNYSFGDVVAGDYLVIVQPNSTYAQRERLVSAPGQYVVLLPNVVTNTVDTINFILLDYTNRFPYLSSTINITKGSNVTQSSFFGTDAGNVVNLIRGTSYTITITNPDDNLIQQWGNYIPAGSTNTQIVIMNIGANETVYKPYTQSVFTSSSEINFSWTDFNSVLVWVNMTIYKNNVSNLVYTLNTSVPSGLAAYIITDSNAIYYATISARTTMSDTIDTKIIDLRTGTEGIRTLSYGTFVFPAWLKNDLAIVLLFILAGTFGALHRGEGAIFTGIFGLYLWWIDWLSMTPLVGGMFVVFVIMAVLYHLNTKAKGGYF